jgi:hypothetical protein
MDRDEALQRAREDLAKARTLAVEWEIEVASVRAQLQQDRATLEEAHAWQCQAEEKAKEAEELRTSVAEKATSLALAEEQLRQERAARQRGRMMEYPATTQNSNCQHTILQDKYSTTLLGELTSWDVVSVTFNFLATYLRGTLCGFFGGAGRLASRLVGGSSIRWTLGTPGELDVDRS